MLSRVSFLPILIAVIFVLSAASESAEQTSKQIRPDKHKAATNNIQKQSDNQPDKSSQFQIDLLETLRAIAKQNKTAYEQGRADEKSWNSPSVLVNICLLIVGGLYTFFAWRQWQTIHGQVDIMVASERAWVGINFNRLYTLGGDFVDMEIFNSGKTPGYIKAVELMGMKPIEKKEHVAYKPESPSSKGAKRIWTIFPNERTIQRWDVKLERGEVIDIANKTKRLPLFGFVLYEDVSVMGMSLIFVANSCKTGTTQ